MRGTRGSPRREGGEKGVMGGTRGSKRERGGEGEKDCQHVPHVFGEASRLVTLHVSQVPI